MPEHLPLRCEVLNGFRMLDGQGRELSVHVVKGKALFAYMVLNGLQSVSREKLAGLLWSEKPEASARTSLRQCLHQLRVQLAGLNIDVVQADSKTVHLDLSQISTDVADLIAGDITSVSGGDTRSLDTLLYGFEDLDPSYSEWLYDFRRRLWSQVCAALTDQLHEARTPDQRLRVAQVLNQIDPALEIAARPVIEDHIRTGNVVELLRVYGALWEALDREWEEEPSVELQDLVGAARADLANRLPDAVEPAQDRSYRKYLCVLALRLHIPDGARAPIAQDLRSRFLTQAAELLDARNARLVDCDQSDLCAVFGLPDADEKLAQDSVAAALELARILDALRGEGQPGTEGIDLSIGLDAGLLDGLDVSDRDGRLRVDGTPKETAVRLAMTTPGGRIVATAHTVGRLQSMFDLRPDPTTPGIVDIRPGPQPVSDSDALLNRHRIFVGRTPFLAMLRHGWSEAEDAGLQLLSILGPPGVGKTYLVGEFMAELSLDPGLAIAVGCNRTDRSAPAGTCPGVVARTDRGTICLRG